MHALAYAYPDAPTEAERESARAFFRALPDLLPCESCRLNVVKELAADPVEPNLDSARKLGEWVSRLHNSVSVRLGKQPVDYADGLKMLFGERATAPPLHCRNLSSKKAERECDKAEAARQVQALAASGVSATADPAEDNTKWWILGLVLALVLIVGLGAGLGWYVNNKKKGAATLGTPGTPGTLVKK
jgi:hypothetical protein